MEVTSSVAPIDQSLIDAAKERPGEELRIRVQPAILRRPRGQTANNFQAWKNLHWMITVTDVTEGRAFREALSAFFYLASQQGIGAVQQQLMAMIPTPTTEHTV